MPERQSSQQPNRSGDGKADGVVGVSRLMEGRIAEQARQRDTHINLLTEAAVHGGRDECLSVVSQILATGVSRETVADDYIPCIARELGDAWCLDDVSFATVTIGVSRLQSLLRDLGPEWRADNAVDPNAGAALIVVALDEYHTLGAMVLAGRLRRQGLSVQLRLGLEPSDLRHVLETPKFDAILISASAGESLDSLRLLVEAVRASASSSVPVVIGGSVVGEHENLAVLTGADFATSDPDEALEHCGLKTSTQIDAPLAPET